MTRPVGARAARRGHARALGGDRGAPRGIRIEDHADEPAPRRRWYRYVAWPAVAGAVGIGAMLASGVPAWRAVLIAIAAAVAIWAVIVSMVVTPPEWPYDVPLDAYRTPSSWQVPGLVGATESEVAFQEYLRPRLWALTQELLRRRGIDSDSPRAVEIVGPREYALLSGTDTDFRHARDSVSVLCHTIARLATAPEPGSPPPLRNPALAGLTGTGRNRIARLLWEGHHR